jgi:FKBP-type peptidyl-prolyl cis-trans isomerase
MKMVKKLIIASLVIGFCACERTTFYNPYAQLEADVAKIDEYLEENDIEAMRSNSGLRYVIHEPGIGAIPQKGNKVIVHYTGTLFDGTKFDSSYDRGEPFEYTHGTGSVIQGWEEGITYISERGKITLYVPSVLAYGSRSIENEEDSVIIEPNSNLIFDIELLSVQ